MHGKKIVSEKCEITVNRKIKDTEGTYILRIKNGFIASNFKPGQFVMLKANEEGLNPLLSRPFSIFNRFGDSEFEVLYRVLGKGTEILSEIAEGSFLEVTGPLGNGFELNLNAVHKVHILIAGGIGIAPLYSLPEYINNNSVQDKIILYYGARKAEELYFRHSIHSRFDEVYFATDDGSFGFKGNIMDMLYENTGSGGFNDTAKGADFYACGPKPMLNALISRFSESGISGRLQASLEESFGCGIGACLGCVIKAKTDTGFEYKRVCKDGPVFYANEILIPEKKPEAVKKEDAKSAEKKIEPDLSVKLGNLSLDYPVMPASGTFGYGEEFFEVIDYNYFGALVTKGISLKPSKGNEMPRICETSCGMINSIGLQNVGFEKFRDEKMPFLRNFNKPVIVNFFGSSIEEYVELAEKLANIGGIGALEANISCPNIKEGGRSFGSDPEVVYELVSSVKEKTGGGLPLIVKLTPMVSDISLIAEVCEKAGADIISLINTIPAAAIDIKTKKFKLNRGYGGLSGAAVKPVALKLVGDVYNAVRIPVIGMGGISSWEDAAEFFLAGATAVAVGTYAFVNPKIIPEITAGLKNYLAENGFNSIYRIIGSVHNNK
ncbi:MAG: dihydroorotate dehydrogenase [Deltaproteobacteria bacterium]|jgi:dihydroorotate dehydrogenase (NAD+) catalytic subunit|nr:dihydroorotate dehydrogenase [Deltaproteobacteria bacterium]